jgi:hypothetical protein
MAPAEQSEEPTRVRRRDLLSLDLCNMKRRGPLGASGGRYRDGFGALHLSLEGGDRRLQIVVGRARRLQTPVSTP